ncbi:ESPR-type extended signal peptide-containing protein [Veillonella sp. 27098_8_77]|uniref:ESPR-type extended signal peptide-containing protein n=1 Tax=Veillonella sp. 27098_8_77 TaxID=3003642 RepID=UPI00352DF16B
MNKIFKVVWSKTKECYVVVSEVAKNNSGKKKVLASVLATLAIMGAGAQMGTPVQADTDLSYSAVNIAPNSVPAGYGPNKVSTNSIVVGYANDTKTNVQGKGHVAYGFGNTATEDSTTAIGGGNQATGGAATAVGSFNTASGRASVAIGNVSIASAEDSIAIGNRANSNPANTDRGSGQFSIAVGRESWAKGTDNISIGHKAETNSTGDSIAMGRESKANQANAIAVGPQADANGWGGIAMGREAAVSANFATAIGYQSKANGSASVAIGKQNKSNMADTVTMGNGNTANTMGGIAIGLNNTADSSIGDSTTANKSNLQIAFGRDNEATSLDTIAIGREVKSTKTGAVAMGSRINANGDYAVAIGNSSAGGTVEAGDYAVAVGFKAKATGSRSIAQGGAAEAGARASIAMGLRSKVNAQKATSNYEFSGSHGTLSPAGYNTETITVNSASVPNTGAVAGNYYDAGSAVAIGDGATVSDESDRAVVVGAGAKTNGNAHYSVVLGSGSHADASDGFVAGHGSSVESRESIAMGSAAHVSGNENIRSQAIGYGATVSGTGAYDATAIGATAQVSGVQGGVALGAGSMLDRTTASNENAGWNSKNLNGTAIRNRAYTADLTGHGDQWDSGRINTGAVSVGNDTQKRQIINVAAGNKDTDAVNVAQLKNVGVRVGADTNTATITVGSNTSNVAADFLAYNGQLNIKGDNNRVTTVSENDANGKDANVNVKFDYDGLVKAKTGSAVTVDQKTDAAGKTYFEIDAAAGSKTVVADGKNTTVTGAGTTASPYKVNVEGALTGISSITNNGGGKIEFTTSGTTISGGPVNVSNNKITGVANGDVNSTSTDAVNGSQLYAVKAAERHIAPTTTGHEYTVDSNGNVTMTYLDGNNKAVTGEQAVITGIAKNDLSNITNEGKKEITKLGTIVKAGDNVNVSESSDATTGRTTYTVNAVTPAVYTKADGTKVYKRPDGTFTTNSNLAAGNNVDKGDVITSFMDGNGNTTGGNMVINNVGSAIKKAGNAGDSFLTKLDAANTATPNAAVNVSDLKNTADGLTDKGLRFDANEGNEKTNKLGSKVTVKGTGALTAGKAYADEYNTANIRTNIEQGSDGNTTINVGLAKALKDINSISNGNSSITLNSNPGGTGNTPAVSITGGNVDVGGNNITNLKSGGDTDSNAANIGDVKKIASDTDTHIKPGTYTVAADKTVTMTYVNGKGETVKANGQDVVAKIDLSGLSTGGTTASSWNVKSSANTTDGGAVADNHNANAQNIADGKSVEFQSGKNLVVKQTNDATGGNATVEFSLSDKIGIGEKGQPGVPGKDGVDGKIGVNGKDGSSVVINGADGSIGMTGPQGKDGKDGINGRDGANISMTSAKGEQVLINRDPAHSLDTDKAERIVYVPKDASGNPIQDGNGKNIVREVATMDDGLKFGGDMGTVGAVKLNKQVDVKGGITDVNKLATGNNIGVTSVPDATTGNTALNIQLAKDLTGLNSVELGGKTIKTDGDHITITSPDTTPGAAPGATTTTKVANLSDEKHIKEGTYAVQNDGSVTLNYQDGNKKDLTETAKITGIAKQDLTNINDAGKNVITGLGTIVKAGDNVTVSEAADATTGQKTYTVNAVTPAIYTDKNGNKVVKRTDGTYTTNLDGSAGNDVAASDVIVSFKDAAGNTTGGNSIVNNIGSAINNHATPGVTSPTYLDKLDAAAGDTKTQNAAVNVTDLKNTADGLTDKGLNFTGNNESTVNKHKLGSLVKVQGEGTKEGTNAAGAKEIQTSDGTKFESAKDNIAVEADSIDKLTIKLNKNLKGINSISNGSTSITLNDAPNATTPAVTIKGGNLSMGDGTTNNKIVNLAPGTADTDAVNYGQIKGLRTEVKPGSNIVVNKTQDSTDGHDIYTISATATGGTASSWNIKSSADTANGGATATDHNANAVNISDQKTVEMVAGKNLTVKQGATTDGAKVEFALSDKIGIGEKGQPGVPGKDGVDGKIGVNGKDGSSVVINGADGSIGMTGPKGQDGKDGINGRNGADISITSAKGEQVLINRDPAHNGDADKAERIVYVPKDASGNPIKGADNKNIVREVATMDDGLKFGGDMGTVGAVKLNKQVDVKGGITDTNKLATGNNIGVTSVPDATTGNTALNIQLAKDLTGLNSVELGGKTIKTDGDHITITTPSTTPGGNATVNKVANLADELHITPGTYEVGATDKDGNAKNDEVTLTYTDGNGAEKANTFAKIKGVANSDLSNISNDGKKNITKLGSIVKAGDNVTVSEKSDATTGQKTYTVNAVTPAVYTKADGTKVYKIVDPTTGAVTWNTKADGTGTPVNANEVIASFETPANGTTQGATTGGTMIVNNIGSAISGHEAKDTAGTVITSPTYLQRLETAAGDNLTKHAAVNVSDLNSAAKELKASELHIAPTEGGTDTDKGGVASGNTNTGAAAQAYKYNAATKQVELTFNDGNGKAVTGPKAVIDFSDLNIPAGGNNYGFKANATANGGKVANDTTTPAAATAVENGGTVNFAAGKNLTVKQDIDAANKTQTYTFSLDKDLTNLDKIVVNGKDGIDSKDGVSITGPKGESAPGAKDGQDGKVGIAGKDGKDAVSISGKDGVGHIGLTGPQGPAGTPGAPGTPGANIDISTDHGTQTLVKQEANNNEKSERIVYVPKDANGNPLKDKDNNPIKREVATMDDGLRFTGNNTSKENKQEMNSLVKVQGEGVTENATSGKLEVNGQEFKSATGNIAVVADGGTTLTVKMNKDLNLTKDGSVTMGDTVVNNDGITIKAPTTPGTTTTDVKLTNQGLDNGGNKITNVAAGTANTDAVNVKQLKDNVTTVESSDSSIKVVDKNAPGSATYDATKGHQYDITINNQGVVNNAQTPVVYTKKDGTKVYLVNGKFYENPQGTGAEVPKAQVIASMNNADNSSTTPMKLNNVGSSIANETGATFLDKLDSANTNTPNGAVNVSDLKSTSDALIDKGLVFDANNADPKTNKLGSKVTIAGTGALATGENFADKYNTDNIRTNIKQDPAGNTTVEIGLNKNLKGLESVSVPGKDGVDGQDGVSITGKDGANGLDGKVSIGKDGKDAVSISGKDGIGHIGLTGAAGKDGTNTKADITVKEGKPGLNGTDGITRIVYKDKDNNDHEVATHDDGVKYAGDDAQGTDKTKVISKKLNETIDIVGGADKTKLTDNNIGVNNDGGKLKVQLIKDVNLTDTGSIKFGDTANNNTVINRGGITITTPAAVPTDPAVTVSLTGNGLNNGGNKITNVKNGTAPTDAATVGQLTKVEAGDNSVTVAHTTTADGQNVYTIKANPAGTVDLTNVNNRIDQLGEEVGRVGAQGAALSALKPIQYDPLEPTQIMAGYGNYRGNSAVALGVAHYKNESTLIHGGVSWAGGSSHMMANAGVTWKVGNRDSEAAVADRYRKGPISSAYAMQQEMAAMKAQNAGLKGEVSDLKAENEQMKAQIAAMMAKLGL